MADDTPVNRRGFFRQGLRELLKPIVKAVEPIHEAVRQLDKLDQGPAIKPPAAVPDRSSDINLPLPTGVATRRRSLDVWLRPPGALPEQRFRETCSRCGECVRVCPAECITIDATGRIAAGAPYINPEVMPCVICDSLACMHNCPSGALLPLSISDIDMGTAEWNATTCLRSNGEDCTICIDECPVGEVAIRLDSGNVTVIEAGCTGCGVCQHACPTSPRSILVIPRGNGLRS